MSAYAKFREGDRVRAGGRMGKVELAVSEGMAEVRWDDGSRTLVLIDDVHIWRTADEQAAVERRIAIVRERGIDGVIQVMHENGDLHGATMLEEVIHEWRTSL